MHNARHKVTPFLWFDGQAEAAMSFYVSLFPGARITSLNRAGPGPDAPVISGSFELAGQPFHALNGGPMYKFSPAISLLVNCETQAEVDELHAKLSAGGEVQPCGWVKDRFGLSWQVIPSILGKLLGDKNPAKAKAAMQAMLTMKKLDIEKLKQAHAQA